ncbi:MAG: outer membrane beta-barrel protein [Cyclobacteriaceae bacterium]|nr:outer membrane beta-barrel protein [Cyclobacteriaceae bacterium]
MTRFYILVVIFVMAFTSASAQSFYALRRERSIILTAGLGSSTYFGDLTNPKKLISTDPSINVGLQYYITKRIALRTELNWFTISGDDKDADEKGRIRRNLSFSSSNLELSAVGIINLYSNGNRFYRRPAFNVYAFGGFAFLYMNPKTKHNGEWVALQPLQTEGVSYSLVQPIVPYGLGFRLKVSPLFNVSFEGGWRKSFTDYLDDVSTVYPAVIPFLSDRGQEIGYPAKPGGIRGNPTNDDAYMLFNVKVEYYLPWQINRRGNGLIATKKRKAFVRYNKNGRLKR